MNESWDGETVPWSIDELWRLHEAVRAEMSSAGLIVIEPDGSTAAVAGTYAERARAVFRREYRDRRTADVHWIRYMRIQRFLDEHGEELTQQGLITPDGFDPLLLEAFVTLPFDSARWDPATCSTYPDFAYGDVIAHATRRR